jgi:hypothetical protein
MPLAPARSFIESGDNRSIQSLIATKESTMKYLCLAYEEERKLNALSQNEWDTLRRETLAYVEALRKSKHLLVTHALQSVQTAATVQVRDGKLLVIDGPFAETKEQLGGFFLIEARDLNEAVQVASRWPSARLGSIEVRPIEQELRQERRYGPVQGRGTSWTRTL